MAKNHAKGLGDVGPVSENLLRQNKRYPYVVGTLHRIKRRKSMPILEMQREALR